LNGPGFLVQEQSCVAGYQLERELARGRQAVVYLARPPGGAGSVALKVARRTRAEAAAGAAPGFEREFAVQAAMTDRHVIRVFDSGWSGGDAFLAMEYAAGGSMAGHRGPVGHDLAMAVLSQAAGALACLHRHGWVHRDVKPANLLLRADGSVALADFGCARRAGSVDALPEGTVVGTPAYAAPEQSAGAAAHPAADVYSLGLFLHEMLTGKPAYCGTTLTELLGQHLLAPVPRLARAHAAWQPLLDAMLAKDPRQRPADAAAVLAQLRRMGPLIRNPT
jgi:serine/threonine protein kinase